MSLNKNLREARRQKNDEFYTQLSDIENELRHYKDYFRDKVVYCNCDDPRVSNFFHYFSHNFEHLGLKKLITACYKNQDRDLFSRHDSERAIWLEYKGNTKGGRVPDIDDIGVHAFKGDGDFRSEETIELLKQADIVVTNPPFSLFREYVGQLMEHEKKFLIIGSKNAITYKEIFPLIKNNKMWLGHGFKNGNAYFKASDNDSYADKSYFDKATGLVKFRNVGWFTNLDHKKRHEDLILYKRYSPEEYPTYDNYDAINVDKTAEIPKDWQGAMGVPITFLDKWNPDQFEILGVSYLWDDEFASHTFYDDYAEIRPDGTKTGMSGKKANGMAVIRGRSPSRNCLVRGDDMVYRVYDRIFVRQKNSADSV
ncbi:MAG: adenine-specific methyltransferase EcoRI family protein [Gammaproteobacteria bacterium]|nr:adenine-specific methyltransferase EcoRI family protein [Gammaproteobacteria bacterium]